MKSFTESDLVFVFSPVWKVKKYDEHPFYQGMSGVGMSAVDFVAIHESGKLLLMEVKNYCNHPAREINRTLNKLEGEKPLLAEILFQKMQNTIAGILAISTYLHRSWWERFRFKLSDRPLFQILLLQSDHLFWMKAAQILEHFPKQVELALWLELPDVLEDKRDFLAKYLKENCQEELPIVQIYDSSRQPNFVEVNFTNNDRK